MTNERGFVYKLGLGLRVQITFVSLKNYDVGTRSYVVGMR